MDREWVLDWGGAGPRGIVAYWTLEQYAWFCPGEQERERKNMAKYEVEEAKDLIARSVKPDQEALARRNTALLDLVAEVIDLSTNGFKVVAREGGRGFAFGDGGEWLHFFADSGRLYIKDLNAPGEHKQIEGLVYNPATNMYEGEPYPGQTGWPVKRANPVTVIVRALLAALDEKGKPAAFYGRSRS